MKTRNGFVSNSSSSSFVMIGIKRKNPKFTKEQKEKIFEKFDIEDDIGDFEQYCCEGNFGFNEIYTTDGQYCYGKILAVEDNFYHYSIPFKNIEETNKNLKEKLEKFFDEEDIELHLIFDQMEY